MASVAPILAVLLACDTSTSVQPDVLVPPPPTAVQPPPADKPLSQEQVERVLTPSPLALEAEVRAAGVADSLGAGVPAERFSRPTTDEDVIAMRTGVAIADAILAGRTDSKEVFLARLQSIRDGMETVGLGKGRLSELDDFITMVKEDQASREDFVAQLDKVTSEAVLSESWGPDDHSGPLVQAGAWLGATQLVARALVAKGDDAAADTLLRRPTVTRYFLDYAKGEGAKKASAPAMEAFTKTLTELDAIARKDKITVQDAAAADKATTYLMDWL